MTRKEIIDRFILGFVAVAMGCLISFVGWDMFVVQPRKARMINGYEGQQAFVKFERDIAGFGEVTESVYISCNGEWWQVYTRKGNP